MASIQEQIKQIRAVTTDDDDENRRIIGELVLASQGTSLGSRSHSSMGRAPPDGLSGPALEVEEECPS